MAKNVFDRANEMLQNGASLLDINEECNIWSYLDNSVGKSTIRSKWEIGWRTAMIYHLDEILDDGSLLMVPLNGKNGSSEIVSPRNMEYITPSDWDEWPEYMCKYGERVYFSNGYVDIEPGAIVNMRESDMDTSYCVFKVLDGRVTISMSIMEFNQKFEPV